MATSNAHTDQELRNQANALLEAKEYSRARDVLERIFDGNDASIAANLGYIFDQQKLPDYDPEKAIQYYKIAAERGYTYAQHALGGICYERGQLEEAAHWFGLCSQAGSGACSYNLYRLFRRRGDVEQARRALELAVQQGNAPAKQAYAIECMLGQRGLMRIPEGLIRYFRNIPALFAPSDGRPIEPERLP